MAGELDRSSTKGLSNWSPPAGLLQKYPNLDKLLGMELPLIISLGEKSLSLEDVLNFAEGSVIVFKKHNSEPLDILVNNRRIGTGKAIKLGERFGIHIREIGSPQETLAKLL